MDPRIKKLRKHANPDAPEHEALARDQPGEDAQKSYHTILEQHVQQATEEIERPTAGLLLSSLSAGLDLGFGPLLMAAIASIAAGTLSGPVIDLLTALGYTVGFVLVVIGRSVALRSIANEDDRKTAQGRADRFSSTLESRRIAIDRDSLSATRPDLEADRATPSPAGSSPTP